MLRHYVNAQDYSQWLIFIFGALADTRWLHENIRQHTKQETAAIGVIHSGYVAGVLLTVV